MKVDSTMKNVGRQRKVSIDHVLEEAGLRAQLVCYDPMLILPVHSHDSVGLAFTFKGAYEELYSGCTLTCGPGTLTYSPALRTHRNRFGPEKCICLTVDLLRSRLVGAEIDRVTKKLQKPFLVRNGQMWGTAAKMVREIRMGDDCSYLAVTGLVTELLAFAVRDTRKEYVPRRRFVVATGDQLREEFARKHSLIDLARAAGVHPVYLATQFKQYYGITIGEFLRRRRVEVASDRLRHSDQEMADLAVECGFSSQSHFCRVFKAVTGTTPLAYRQTYTRPPKH